jgi:hypothetical protein
LESGLKNLVGPLKNVKDNFENLWQTSVAYPIQGLLNYTIFGANLILWNCPFKEHLIRSVARHYTVPKTYWNFND